MPSNEPVAPSSPHTPIIYDEYGELTPQQWRALSRVDMALATEPTAWSLSTTATTTVGTTPHLGSQASWGTVNPGEVIGHTDSIAFPPPWSENLTPVRYEMGSSGRWTITASIADSTTASSSAIPWTVPGAPWGLPERNEGDGGIMDVEVTQDAANVVFILRHPPDGVVWRYVHLDDLSCLVPELTRMVIVRHRDQIPIYRKAHFILDGVDEEGRHCYVEQAVCEKCTASLRGLPIAGAPPSRIETLEETLQALGTIIMEN